MYIKCQLEQAIYLKGIHITRIQYLIKTKSTDFKNTARTDES